MTRAAEPGRLKEVVPRAIAALHALATDLELTNDELLAVVAFLNEVGRADEFMLLSDVLGLSVLVDDQTHLGSSATASNVLGPFYRPGAPWIDDRGCLARPDEPGRRLTVRGTVVDVDSGAPISGAVLDVWQSNAAGDYSNEDAGLDPFNLRGRLRTDASGSYAFETVMPVPYEVKKDGPVGRLLLALHRHAWRPAHVHVMVTADGHEPLVTMAYFAGDPFLGSDTIGAVKPSLVLAPTAPADDALEARFDIMLAPLPATAYGRGGA